MVGKISVQGEHSHILDEDHSAGRKHSPSVGDEGDFKDPIVAHSLGIIMMRRSHSNTLCLDILQGAVMILA